MANTAFLKPYGFHVQSCAPGECTVVVPYTAYLERPSGTHEQRGTTERWATTDMKTALRSARETDIYCIARILKLGKRTSYGAAECRDVGGRLLAHHVISYS
jgi:acyl-coenzyme A thioesterase PaaI-like protein